MACRVFYSPASAFKMIHRSRRVLGCTEIEHGDLFLVHTLTSGGVVHVKVDLHLDSVHGRGGHIQQATYTSLKGRERG